MQLYAGQIQIPIFVNNMGKNNHVQLVIYWLMVYLMTLSVTKDYVAREVGQLMNNELDKIWKQTVVA
jgi:hypothetical protein